MVLHVRLSFGPFEFEPHSGRLTKHGHRIKLQPKSAAILSCLLDHPGEVVAREHLQKRLWPEGVHVDFELGIKVAVKKLRDALGDDSSEPVYIQTVHGEGYRFIAPVDATEDRQAQPLEDEPATGGSTGLSPRGRLIWLAAAALILVMIAGATLLPLGTGAASLHFQDRDWIIIVPFENLTGDKLLDGTLEAALERALSESRYVNIAPRDRINDALTLMRQSPATKLSEDLARQVAIRDGGIKAVVGGRVEKLGSKYVLTVRLLNPENSQPVAFIEKNGAKEGLLEAAQSASDDLRRKLGEKSFHHETPANLEKATTASLAALRAFSAGMEQVNLRKWREAAPLLEEAIVQDPQFATAHIYAAHSFSNLRQPERAAPHYQAAFRLATGVTQRERLFILGSYYQRFLGDDERAADAYRALINLYPDDYWGMNNIIGCFQTLGTWKDHAELVERVVALRPNTPNVWLRMRLWEHYTFVRPDDAKAREIMAEIRRVRQRQTVLTEPELSGLYGFDAFLNLERVNYHWARGEVVAAAHELDAVNKLRTTNTPEPVFYQDLYKMNISKANLALGRLRAATDLCASIENPAVRDECFLRIAFSVGDRALGRQHLDHLRATAPVAPASFGVDLVLAVWLGETTLANRWYKSRPGPWTSSVLLVTRGRPEEAVRELSAPYIPRGLEFLNDYYLASALEQQGKVEDAASRLVRSRINAVAVEVSSEWPQCRLKLAELYRKAHLLHEAEQVEEEMRHFLSAADPDHPVLRALARRPAR